MRQSLIRVTVAATMALAVPMLSTVPVRLPSLSSTIFAKSALSVVPQTDDVSRELAAAKELYEQGRFGQALAKLQATIGSLERADSPGARSLRQSKALLEDAHLHLGLSYVALDDPDGARQAFEAVLGLSPDRRLDPTVYAPKVIEIFEQARAQNERARTEQTTTVTVPPTSAGSGSDSTDEGGLSGATIGLIAGGAGAAVFLAVASGGGDDASTTTTPGITPATTTTTSVAATTTTIAPANAIDVLYRVNGARGGSFSCSQPMSFTIDASNNTTSPIRISRYELRMTSLSSQCSTHTPPIDGSYNRDLGAGASAELRRVDLSGDLCREQGVPGCSWRALVSVVTEAGTFQDSFELTTSN